MDYPSGALGQACVAAFEPAVIALIAAQIVAREFGSGGIVGLAALWHGLQRLAVCFEQRQRLTRWLEHGGIWLGHLAQFAGHRFVCQPIDAFVSTCVAQTRHRWFNGGLGRMAIGTGFGRVACHALMLDAVNTQ